MPMSLDEYERLKKKLQNLQNEHQRTKGKLEQVEEQIRKTLKTEPDSLEQAIVDAQKEYEELDSQCSSLVERFTEKWNDLLT